MPGYARFQRAALREWLSLSWRDDPPCLGMYASSVLPSENG